MATIHPVIVRLVTQIDATGHIIERRLTAFEPDSGASWRFVLPTLPTAARSGGAPCDRSLHRPGCAATAHTRSR